MKVRVRVEPPKAVTVSVVVLVRHADNVRIGPKTITENGTFYPANESLDGYSPVVVDVKAQPKLQDKTVDPAIVPVKVKADPPNDGLGEVTVNAMPVEEQVTPQITVDEKTGVVTAMASQPSGYVVGGTKENSKQLETKGAQIYTPGDEEKIIPAGVFLTGKQTLAKVPTQEATITENGEHIPPSGRYYSKVVVAVPESGGTDTDDANATPSDMASGKSGYVKGEKVEGILPVKAAGTTETVDGEGFTIEGGKLKMTTTAPADAIYRAGAKTEVRTNADALGIATPDMVLEDATFTSKDGIGQEGTIPRNGDTSATFDGIAVKSVEIPAGYTTGGTVALDGTIDNAVEAAKTSIANKGVEVPTDTDVRGLAGLIDSIAVSDGEPVYDPTDVKFGSEAIDPDQLYKVGYNWVAQVVDHLQDMVGRTTSFTLEEIVYWLGRVKYIPQGYAESTFTLDTSMFTAGASGILPDVQKGTATSVFTLDTSLFTSSASGALVEG